jgi:hypothetical protein
MDSPKVKHEHYAKNVILHKIKTKIIFLILWHKQTNIFMGLKKAMSISFMVLIHYFAIQEQVCSEQ